MRRGDGVECTGTERGAVLVWMVVVVALAALAATGAARTGREVAGSARAQAVADLAALAAVERGSPGATSVAAANGARVLRCECAGPDVQVRVSWGGHEARAAARRSRADGGGPVEWGDGR